MPRLSLTGTQTSVAASASDVVILAANGDRLGATIYNDSTVVLYVLLSNAVSSTTKYTVQIPPSGYYELPTAIMYAGVIKGIWASATGNARVTEYTP